MKPQTGAYQDKARELLQQADTVMGAGLNEAAARAAYMAALRAARALIFENTNEVTSSHHRVQSQFWTLTKDEPRIDPELRAFLSRLRSSNKLLITTPAPPPTSQPKPHGTPLQRRADSRIALPLLSRRTVTRRTHPIP
jgi:uncharacterized protein (UPF0332 family)